MVLGNGTIESIDEYKDAERLKNQLYSMIISSVEQSGNNCTCKASIKSEAVDQGFYPYELGLYAMDGDTEVLYIVSYDSTATYVPGKDEGKSVELEFDVPISFSAAANVSITLPTTAEEIVALVQNNAIKSEEAAKLAETSKNDSKNAATSESNAKASEKAAKETADSIAASTAADVKTATDQAKAAADSARDAADSKNTAEELYRRWCVDIVGPPAAAMSEADLFVAPGAAAMAAMGR